MDLCIVTHKLIRNDGQGRINAETAAAMAAKGHRVVVLSTEIDSSLLQCEGISWFRITIPRWLPSSLLRYQLFALKTWWRLRSMGAYDVIQVNGGITYSKRRQLNLSNFVHADWLACPSHPWHKGKTPTALYQYIYARLNMVWERRAYHRAEKIIALSNQVRTALIKHTGVAPEAIEVITPGVDPKQFRPLMSGEPNELRKALRLDENSFVLLFVGDIRSNRKNLDLVLHSLARLPKRMHLAVLGDATRSPYPARAKDLGIGGRVHFLGKRTTDVASLMRGADTFVFPSHYDTFALVVTEAMASGVPVITTPTVGASSLISHGLNGFLIPHCDDLESLTAAILKLEAEPAWATTVKKAARDTAEQNTWASMAAHYERVYLGVFADRHRCSVTS